MIEFIDKSSENDGTLLDRSRLMGLQGFTPSKTEFIRDEDNIIKSVVEYYHDGTKTTTFNGNTIVEIFEGEKTITKTTTFDDEGNIEEVIS